MEKREGMYFNKLDLLRGCAALGIIMMHVLLLGDFTITTFFHNIVSKLSSFIELFFILSGFSMCCGYYQRFKNNDINLEQFYANRFMKIVPLFIVVSVIESIFTWKGTSTAIQLFANSTMMFGFMSNNSIEVASIGWTLGVIFIFYMLFPFFVFMLSSKLRGLFTLFVSLGIHFACKYYFLQEGQYQNFTLWLYEFVIGGLLFLFLDYIRRINKVAIFTVTIIITAIVILLEGYGYSIKEFTAMLFSLWIMCGIVASGNKQSAVESLSHKYSFEIYLLQMIVFRLIERIKLTHILGDKTVGYVFSVVLTVSGSLLAAYIWNAIFNKLIALRKAN
jgi:peptidoglycan/LPS O-acetylase OafA/YrhL